MNDFVEYYRKCFLELFDSAPAPNESLDREQLKETLRSLQLTIPTSLFEYHVFAGRHWINEELNRLRPVEELSWIDDRLIFADENQDVVCWGINRSDIALDDPVVWQGVNGDTIEWYSEKQTLSRFLMAMWKWTVTGELPPTEN